MARQLSVVMVTSSSLDGCRYKKVCMPREKVQIGNKTYEIALGCNSDGWYAELKEFKESILDDIEESGYDDHYNKT